MIGCIAQYAKARTCEFSHRLLCDRYVVLESQCFFQTHYVNIWFWRSEDIVSIPRTFKTVFKRGSWFYPWVTRTIGKKYSMSIISFWHPLCRTSYVIVNQCSTVIRITAWRQPSHRRIWVPPETTEVCFRMEMAVMRTKNFPFPRLGSLSDPDSSESNDSIQKCCASRLHIYYIELWKASA